jgi:hypothetical protein
MFMSRWKLEQERRERKRRALLLLIVSGVVRPADVEIRYRGTDVLIGTWSSDIDLRYPEAVANHRSIWNTYIRELWETYRLRSAQVAVRMKRYLIPHRQALQEHKSGTSGNH